MSELWKVIHADALETLRKARDEGIDAIVTDPPYELGFMGKKWDGTGIVYLPEFWAEALRVLKPGGHLLAFGATRTYHRMVCAIEDAGFEIRDSIHWVYGSGFPKSQNVAKMAEKKGDDLSEFDGWHTALKPAHEPVVVARKPLTGTVAANVLEYGTGAINVDGCRVPGVKDVPASPRRAAQGETYGDLSKDPGTGGGWDPNTGRWPTNLVLGEPAAEEMDEQSGNRPVGGNVRSDMPSRAGYDGGWHRADSSTYADSGGASRFFPVFKYQAKAPKKERPVVTTEDGRKITHPTVKPIALMRWLVRLVTPPGGVVLDPFAGTGTTLEAAHLEGFRSIGIESDADSVLLIHERMSKHVESAA